jgi:hypothetical protein
MKFDTNEAEEIGDELRGAEEGARAAGARNAGGRHAPACCDGSDGGGRRR